MQHTDLRVALFSGNYNYVRDGANRALNRLVDYLLRQGAHVRVYSPTTDTPAFEPAGDLVSVKSMPLPFGRAEYRLAIGLTGAVREDLERFSPNIVHVSSPDILGHRAVSWARRRLIPVLASAHTRFDTYLRYYHMGFAEPTLTAALRRFYRRCNAVVAPSESFAQVMRDQRMNYDISLWERGIDAQAFNPQARDMAWRRSIGLDDDEVAIGFLGRLVMEKGLDVVADSIAALAARGVPHRLLVVGEGPARDWLAARMPQAIFTGYQAGSDLTRAVASMDLLFNPSVTESFGNVTLEAMACHLPVVAARATGSVNLVHDGSTGKLVTPGDSEGFADALAAYITAPPLRAAHGEAALAISRRYDWDSINDVVLQTYLRLLQQRKLNG